MDARGNQAISLLPEEMWNYILDLVVADNLKTLQTCSLTCNLWFQILRNYKFRLAFPLVFYQLYPYLTGNAILSCRLVSKKWFRAVSLNHPEVKPKITVNLDRAVTRIQGGSYQVIGEPLEQREVAPSLDSFAQLREWRAQRARNLRQNSPTAFVFRSVIGDRININLDTAPFNIRALEVYFANGLIRQNISMLFDALSRVPFVEYLKLSAAFIDLINRPNDRILQRDLMLPHLLKLKTFDVTGLPNFLQKYLTSSYKSTIVANYQEAKDTCLVLFGKENPFRWWKGPISLLSTQIEERVLSHAHFSIASRTNLPEMLNKEIQHFRNTLQILSIKYIRVKLPDSRILGDFGLNELNVDRSSEGLPESIDELAASFEFLKDCLVLEQLNIQFWLEEYNSLVKNQSKKIISGQFPIIDFVNNLEKVEDLSDDDTGIRKLYESNIWSILPKLRRIRVSIFGGAETEGKCQMKRVYTRIEFNDLYPYLVPTTLF